MYSWSLVVQYIDVGFCVFTAGIIETRYTPLHYNHNPYTVLYNEVEMYVTVVRFVRELS